MAVSSSAPSALDMTAHSSLIRSSGDITRKNAKSTQHNDMQRFE
jgi:hypothetical protein